ncbi:TIM-barrel domain-containing protein [Polymorphum gilvum]|uniref:Glycoside hydrolase family 31 n=1 Tax=Polymorphum gilvum (strain LMG 25793 / CGMCC 1.9160 / SL003B-26A1) TaxID=991905 RepID=F2IXK1_POLGS|nr:glycoside hydrolase family 31 protein [Polymorphum gilvum]ADZ71624.1 Glycoside hydrolase family 31 [Polymorphum gilvum SL003B-26A1]
MKPLKSLRLEHRFETGLDLRVDGRHLLTLFVLDDALIRVLLRKDGAFRLDRTWTVAPQSGSAPTDVPWQGRSRLDLAGFACPPFAVEETGDGLVLTTACLRLTVTTPLTLTWQARQEDGSWRAFAQDRPTGAYMLGVKDHAHAHFLLRQPGERVYGLGEKAGELERSGRRFEMRNLDAMGYDARSTDPLYKHIPFTATRTADAGSYGLFYDNLAGCWFDLGNELDNYHKPYRAYRAQDGDLDYYMSWAPSLRDVVRSHVRLTGGTAFPPLWSLGYSGSTMHYTDAPDAQAQLEGFVRLVAEHDIPCDSFQLSSGYSSIGAKRYVFTWNRDKVPDPSAMARIFAEAGIHLAANIKPCLLQDHPMYGEAAERGLFVRDSEEAAPARSPFWDDEGSNLDFTNPDTIRWWQDNIAGKLLAHGIGSTWNDNNEFEVWDGSARCHGFGEETEIGLIRPLMPVLMTRASHEAQVAHAPDRRPYLISRSGAPGLQRYAQTWSGDNRTSWETLRYNIRMGLGMSLSGLYNIGHDVGGFAGPRPDPELFVRWVQNGIFHPRFTIHSWNDDGTVNEPWMYPEATPLVRAAITLRYRLLPYLYTTLYRAVAEAEPMLRPTFLDHEHDPRCFAETDDFLIGRDLLVASVVEPGARVRRVYLPDNATGWWDFWTGTWHAGGQDMTVPVTLASMPLFVRAGTVLPLADGLSRADAARDSRRTLAVYPASGRAEVDALEYADDGISADALESRHCLTRFSLRSDADALALDWRLEGCYRPCFDSVVVTLPAGERRPLTVNGRPAASGATVAYRPA